MAIKIVAFDVHETLTHWPENRVQPLEVQRLLERYGIQISYQAYEVARQAVFMLDGPKRGLHGYVDFLALIFDRMGVRVSLDLIESIAAMYESRNNMEIYPDAIPAIREAQRAGKFACTFTTLPAFMLGRAAEELIPLLDEYLDGRVVGVAKGDRRFYEGITRHLGADASEILCVGDDPIGDCEVPAEIGWRSILLDRAGIHAETRTGQSGTIRTLEQLSQFYGAAG